MESLDQPGQAYYEGTPSPVEHHSKRDSAYSSFSASSNTSDCALSLRPEENAGPEGPCKPPEGRYLQTGAEGTEPRHPARHPVPPQPPVRRDSLRASPAGSGADRRRASVPTSSLHAQGRWISDTFLCQRDKDAEATSGRMPAACPPKEHLSADQYYMLSSHPDRCLGDAGDRPYPETTMQRGADAGMEVAGDTALLSPLQGHRHSAPEQLLASQLRALQVSAGSGRASPASPAPEGHRWTTSPLHAEHRGQGGLSPAPSTEGLAEESRAGGRRAGGPPNRSSHFRRRSERFATNLRNEIQRRKAQLQKSRGPGAQARGEEPVEEAEEPAEGSPSPAPSEDGRSCSGESLPVPEAERVAPSRGRWRWSPERKLQPQRSPSPREHKGGEEAVLLPFADRRRFFEESSRPAPTRHGKPQKPPEPDSFQAAEHRDARRVSGPYSECCREQPPYYKVLPRHGELEYLRGCSYPYGGPGLHEPCHYCAGEMCPALLPRGHAYRCHPWARCPDCCCPAPRPPREESDSWAPRKAFVPVSEPRFWDFGGALGGHGSLTPRARGPGSCLHAASASPRRNSLQRSGSRRRSAGRPAASPWGEPKLGSGGRAAHGDPCPIAAGGRESGLLWFWGRAKRPRLLPCKAGWVLRGGRNQGVTSRGGPGAHFSPQRALPLQAGLPEARPLPSVLRERRARVAALLPHRVHARPLVGLRAAASLP